MLVTSTYSLQNGATKPKGKIMTEENTQASQEAIPTPTAPAADSAPVTTEAPAAAQAPAPEQPKKPQIKVNPKKNFNKNDMKDKREWLAKIRQENTEFLRKSGYAPDAVVEILRFMHSGDKKYPYAKGLKSPLVHMLANVANSIHYQTKTFNSSDVSELVCLLVDVLSVISNPATKVGEVEFMKSSGDDCHQFIRATFDKIWETHNVTCNQNMARAKSAFVRAINSPKNPESIPARCRYLLECIIEITMNMVDPFTGIFHDEPVPVPEELAGKVRSYEELAKAKREMRRQGGHRPDKRPPLKCKQCGADLIYVEEIDRNICVNVLCPWGTTKEIAIERWKGKESNPRRGGARGKGHDGHRHDGFHSKVAMDTRSASDKFKAKYDKRTKVIKTAVEKTIAAAAPKDEMGTNKSFSSGGVWDALDGLKLS